MIEDKRAFFRADVFQVLADELGRRYYHQKNFGVSVGKKLLEGKDTEPLRELMGVTPLDWAKMQRVSLTKLEAALQNSIFSWGLVDFVCFVRNKPLQFKGELELERNQRFTAFCAIIKGIDPIFMEKLSEKQLMSWFQAGEEIFPAFRQVSKALQHLPKEYTRIPFFAYSITGDSHFFDERKPAGQLLLQMLAALSDSPGEDVDLSHTERKHQLLTEFYLLRDDIMNDVAVRGLAAKKDGEVNPMWQQAALEACSWKVPLKEILRMDEIFPFKGRKVWVVENSGVYSVLLDLLPTLPIICSSGQFSYAVWQILRKINRGGNQIFYVGDHDPEGLLMAQRLLDLFPENAWTIGMNLENYEKAARPGNINSHRLKQLRSIHDPELRKIADQIMETGNIALQEGFLNELIEEAVSIFGEQLPLEEKSKTS